MNQTKSPEAREKTKIINHNVVKGDETTKLNQCDKVTIHGTEQSKTTFYIYFIRSNQLQQEIKSVSNWTDHYRYMYMTIYITDMFVSFQTDTKAQASQTTTYNSVRVSWHMHSSKAQEFDSPTLRPIHVLHVSDFK